MNFKSPYKVKYRISQGFSKNFNPYYKGNGLLGHSGIDLVAPHLTPVYAVIDAYCYSVGNKDNADLARYRAVYTIIEDAGTWYEVSYGHLGDIHAKPGAKIKAGDPIGTQSNTGNVFVGGFPPTEYGRKIGAGSHLHLQVRLVMPVMKKNRIKNYLMDANGYLKYENKYFEIVNFDNGFNGCIDPQPFFNKFVFTETLRYGSRGDEVRELQEFLQIPSDGIFGTGTLNEVKKFQKKNKLTSDGIVGKSTRDIINKLVE